MNENVVPFPKRPLKSVRPLSVGLIENAANALESRVKGEKKSEADIANRALIFYEARMSAMEGLELGETLRLTVPEGSDNVFQITRV